MKEIKSSKIRVNTIILNIHMYFFFSALLRTLYMLESSYYLKLSHHIYAFFMSCTSSLLFCYIPDTIS